MKKVFIVFILVSFFMLSSCTLKPEARAELERESMRPVIKKVVRVRENAVPGTVNNDWIEPMYDQISIPGRLDPEGVYYRKKTETVVEIREDRFQPVQYPPSSPEAQRRIRQKQIRTGESR